MNKYKNIPRKNSYSSLKQALEQRMLYDATLVHPPTEPGVTGVNESVPHAHAASANHPINTANTINEKNQADILHGRDVASKDITTNTEANSDHKYKLMEFHQFTPTTKEIVFVDETLKND